MHYSQGIANCLVAVLCPNLFRPSRLKTGGPLHVQPDRMNGVGTSPAENMIQQQFSKPEVLVPAIHFTRGMVTIRNIRLWYFAACLVNSQSE
jgi:hypothetical protein